jgi:hypothetical protein
MVDEVEHRAMEELLTATAVPPLSAPRGLRRRRI